MILQIWRSEQKYKNQEKCHILLIKIEYLEAVVLSILDLKANLLDQTENKNMQQNQKHRHKTMRQFKDKKLTSNLYLWVRYR